MIFLDTSALVKRYVAESGSDIVLHHMEQDLDWAASVLARTEARVTLCHRGPEGALESPAQKQLAQDWDRFITVPIDPGCLASAEDIGCQQHLRTLDAIHLAAASRLPTSLRFLSFDRRQRDAAVALGLSVVPVEG